jgi:hypothetical protein
MGPSIEFTRLWLLGSQPRDVKHLAKAEDLLATTAWENIRVLQSVARQLNQHCLVVARLSSVPSYRTIDRSFN